MPANSRQVALTKYDIGLIIVRRRLGCSSSHLVSRPTAKRSRLMARCKPRLIPRNLVHPAEPPELVGKAVFFVI